MILGSCTILNSFDPLWLNIELYMRTMYTLDVGPESVISYPSSNPNILYNYEFSRYSYITIILVV